MSSSPSQVQFYPSPSAAAEDEIDLRQVAAALCRRRRLIAVVTGVSIFISGIFALTRKPVWEGQFQIVVENEDSGGAGRLSQLVSSQLLSSISGDGNNQLNTELKVLESPSVLQPTYNFVKDYKAKEGKTQKAGPLRTGEKKI